MGHYVYKYVHNDEIIYIGKCDKDLEKRISQHGKKGDNIPTEAWNELKESQIYFYVTANAAMSDVIESELIRKYKPKYNNAKTSEWTGLPFPELDWSLYQQRPQKNRKKPKPRNAYSTARLIQKYSYIIQENSLCLGAVKIIDRKIQKGEVTDDRIIIPRKYSDFTYTTIEGSVYRESYAFPTRIITDGSFALPINLYATFRKSNDIRKIRETIRDCRKRIELLKQEYHQFSYAGYIHP